ncbi:MAG TPA: hypothetical protein VFV28_04575 [Limnobacter sp.]|nr:hypothetical protein [Limnobacter sp.]
MSTQVIGSVNELEGSVSIMRDGETRSLAAGDSILAGDVIKASESGRTAIVLSNSIGEPIGNLLVAPGGSVIADTTIKNGQSTLVFEALSEDGVSISNLDPDFAELVELQGVGQAGSGGMSGLFGGGLLAAGSVGGTAAAVGAGAVGLGLLASSSDDEGSGPTSSVGSGGNGGGGSGGSGGGGGGTGGGGGGDGGGDTSGTTGTPLDAVVDPVLQALATTPLSAVSEPLGDALGMIGGAAAGDGGSGDGPTGTPLDAVLGPLADAAGGAGGGSSDGPTGTPLDAILGPLAGAAEGTPLAPISSMLSPDAITGALGGGLPV